MTGPDDAAAQQLAARLRAVGYTVESVCDLLGPVAADALDRDQVVPAQHALADDRTPLATAVRLFLLGVPVPRSDVVALLGDAVPGALLVSDGDDVRASVELAPYAADDVDWLIAADWPPGRTGRPASGDHVLGVGGASTMLAQCTVRPEVDSALDIGTGCGIQAFHLTRHTTRVVATDVSRRCLHLARFNAVMNGLDVELRYGSLLAPVQEERFDLVVSNPPFVIASPDAERHDYRDSGLPGDEVCERLVHGAASLLRAGGWCQLLANWEIADDDWAAGPSRWLDASPLDAWVVQREVQDPAAYVETWLRDSGAHAAPDHADRYDAWLSALAARGVVGVGFGLVTLRAGGNHDPVRRLQHAPQPLVQPVGPDVAAWFHRQDLLAANRGADVLRLALRTADDVVVDVRYRPGQDEPEAVVVRRSTGFAWAGALDPFGHAVLDGADAARPVGEVVAALAQADGLDVADTLSAAVPVIRKLVEEGFLVPGEASSRHAGTVERV